MSLAWVLASLGIAIVVVAIVVVIRRRSSRRQEVVNEPPVFNAPVVDQRYEKDISFDDDVDGCLDTVEGEDSSPLRELLSVQFGSTVNASVRLNAEASDWSSLALGLDGKPGPLPRSGLFVRRNNEFGTKATLGIADLVDQGVLIDQAQIRFDDFVASNPSGIPTPSSGEALAVSHGTCEAREHFRANENTTHFVELALRAGEGGRGTSPNREMLPVNFVFVVDTSLSMEGEKLDTVKSAIRGLYSQLRDTDVLGIVTFDTRVRTLLKATPKHDIPAARLDEIVTGLGADGGTDINLGVLYGIDEIARHSQADVVNCLYLFSDGDPNSGERNWITIRRNIADRIRGDLTLSCFGFGADARMRELEALAGLTGGSCLLVTTPDDVRLNLAEDLARRDHLAAINIQLQIRLDAEITAWHLYGHDLITDPPSRARVEREVSAAKHRAREEMGVESLPDLVTEDDGIRIFAPDLAFDETYWVVLEVQAPQGWQGFGQATVQYVDAVARDNRRHVVDLGPDTTIAAETVFAHAVGLWTSEVTFYALDDLYQNDRESAGRRLAEHVEVLSAAHSQVPAPQFRDDQTTFRKLISLSSNLGQIQAWTDGGDVGYTIFAMNRFGQSRSGFIRNRFS
ncbi:VWA domain-containing protein [Lentzea kentuckyensis]|uniref:VWA domain-containing protein n=1 Tax=Lentzea kentuckyensis TaxID=360086 RepID=UPI000A37433F|nr:VWA domain-containing protein [Lentzea kentuckyensis]